MNKLSEASEINGKIYLSGWLKAAGLFILIIWGFVSGITLYTYSTVLPRIIDSIVLNDKESRDRDEILKDQITNNKILIAGISSMQRDINSLQSDINEIKGLLKRTTPFERKTP